MWSEIEARGSMALDRKIAELLENENRLPGFTVDFETLKFDYSKTQILEDDRDALLQLAGASGLDDDHIYM